MGHVQCPDLELHKAVFNNEHWRLSQLINPTSLSVKDPHGNTALHLAVMLGHKECIDKLLECNECKVNVKNLQGWSPLAEAISYGDRSTVLTLLKLLKKQSRQSIDQRRGDLVRALNSMGDFRMELKWDFQSWVPLVSRILPSDVCRIYKKGCSIRLDTTLVDFNDMKWERGDISFLFLGDAKPNQSLVILDNKLKIFQIIRPDEHDMDIEEEVNLMMSNDIVAIQMSTKPITFNRAQTGWLFKAERSEMVGAFLAHFYSISGLCLESRKRREHLSEEDLQKNRLIIENLTKLNNSANSSVNSSPTQSECSQGGGGSGGGIGSEPNARENRRKSLPKPAPNRYTWNQYINAEPGRPPCIGREIVCKENSKTFKATVAMSQDFPLSVSSLLNVLEIIAPFKHFTKLREFVKMKLPPGFPVSLNIPILPTVTARVTFQEFCFDDDIPDSLFDVPPAYREDHNRFPELM